MASVLFISHGYSTFDSSDSQGVQAIGNLIRPIRAVHLQLLSDVF